MRKLLIAVCVLMGHLVVAQEKMTDFESISLKTTNGIQKIDTINSKFLFYFIRPEDSEAKLWVIERKPENTRLLHNEAENELDGSYRRLRTYNYLYIIRDNVYHTKGNTLEKVIFKVIHFYKQLNT